MLIDQQYSDILPFLGEVVEGMLDSLRLSLGIDDEEVLLRAWRLSDMLGVCQSLNEQNA